MFFVVLMVFCAMFWVVRFSGPQFRCLQLRGRGTTDTRAASVTFVGRLITGCVTDTWPRRLRLHVDQKSKPKQDQRA